MSDDPLDLSVLTPEHFLIGSPLISIPDPSRLNVPYNRLSLYQGLQKTFQSFWKSWSRDYLCSLQQRHRWQQQGHPIKQGDMVIIKEENIPPLRWRLARVMKLHTGSDGITRVVSLKTSKGTLTRAIQYIYPLPLDEEYQASAPQVGGICSGEQH